MTGTNLKIRKPVCDENQRALADEEPPPNVPPDALSRSHAEEFG